MKRVVLIVLDSAGIGELPDANEFGDVGSHTLGNIYKHIGRLNLPNLYNMGLGNINGSNLPSVKEPVGAYGKMAELTKAKDTISGHLEIAGLLLSKPFKTYPNGFPEELICEYERAIGRKIIGNEVASGTEIISRLGDKHVQTGCPIVYTSADSVFQIAAHEKIISLDMLYKFCEKAYDMLYDKYRIGRVIARPFEGESGNYKRTENRRDFTASPESTTMLDVMVENNLSVHAIGKIEDIFAGRGITSKNHTTNNEDGINATIEALSKCSGGLIFTNLVDFDMLYGHRNDVLGYASALEYFDSRLSQITELMSKDDLLIITADHGCDPTTKSTDHSREYVPLLVFGDMVQSVNLGIRDSFSDIGATICDYLGIKGEISGESFLSHIIKR